MVIFLKSWKYIFQFASYQLSVATVIFRIDCSVFKYESLEMIGRAWKRTKYLIKWKIVPQKQSVYICNRHVLISLFVVHFVIKVEKLKIVA